MKKRRLLLSGGGTGGSVAPLLAVVEQARLKNLPYEFFWAGTSAGPGQQMIASYGIPFFILPGGKWRRYWNAKNFFTPFLVLAGFIKSFVLLLRLKPDAVLTAGGFVSVPLVWATWCFKIPVTVHEQDAERGLANKLMIPFASLKTSVWPRADKKSIVIGNFVRSSVDNGNAPLARQYFRDNAHLPLVLVIGGGTGALALNQLIIEALPFLREKILIIHLTGNNKQTTATPSAYYYPQAFAGANLPNFYAAAEIVVSRAGMATLSELARLGKAAIVIPIPDSHQEANAKMLAEHKAAVVLSEKNLTSEILAQKILNLLKNEEERRRYGDTLHNLIIDGTDEFLRHLEVILSH